MISTKFKNKLSLFLVLISFALNAQTKVYKLDPIHTARKLEETRVAPSLYSVILRKLNFTTGGGIKKVINKDYIELERKIEELREIQSMNEEEQGVETQKATEIKSIGVLLNDFLASKSDFNDKKSLLKEAQNLAIKYNIEGLIYSDSEINTDAQAKFKLLSMNDFDFKIHLKRILWEYEKMDFNQKDTSNTTETDSNTIKLAELEEQLSVIKKYNSVKLSTRTTTRSALLTGSKVPSAKKLQGDFVPIGIYYILKKDVKNKYKKGEIISSKELRNSGLKNTNLVTHSQLLFRNKRSKAMYITESNFLNKFAFLINGKFNKNSHKKKSLAAL